MNYAQIRKRAIERMGEYTAGAAETAALASISGQTIYDRIAEIYRDMVGEIAQRDPGKVLAVTTMSYGANAESASLPSGVQYRPVFDVEWLSGSVDYVPLREITLDQHRQALKYGELPEDAGDDVAGYAYRIEGASIYMVPKPMAGMTLRLRYLAAIADLTDSTDDANSPSLVQIEDHATLALAVAVSFLREVGNPASLDRELQYKWGRFLERAAHSPKTGPRFVRVV